MWLNIRKKISQAIQRIAQKFLCRFFKNGDLGDFLKVAVQKRVKRGGQLHNSDLTSFPPSHLGHSSKLDAARFGVGCMQIASVWANKSKQSLKMIVSMSALLLLLSSCKSPFDPTETGAIHGQEISIHYLKSLYNNQPLRITEDYVIRGQVVSSDGQGNFRWTLVVEDATGGIELKIGLNPYNERFVIGQEVRVKCAGLVLGAYGRTIQLGVESDNESYETGFIVTERLGEHIFPAENLKAITPAVLQAGEISMRYVNCAVRFENLCVVDQEVGLTWGDGMGYVERHFLFEDSPADTLAVRTSPTAVFAKDKLPSETISLEGVLTQFAGKYSLVLNEAPK